MKRRYQIEKQRAVNGFRQLAAEQNPTIRMMLPMPRSLACKASGACCGKQD